MPTLGPFYPSNGNTAVQHKIEYEVKNRTYNSVDIIIESFIRRTIYYSGGTSGTITVKHYVDRIEQPNFNKKITIYGNESTTDHWVSLGSKTYSYNLEALESKTIEIGFKHEKTYSDGPNNFTTDNHETTVTINAYATKVGAPTVSIINNGNNTFSITATQGVSGDNNTPTGVSPIEYSINSKDYNLTYSNGSNIEITENSTIYARATTIGTYGVSDYGTTQLAITYIPPYVKIWAKHNGQMKQGTLYARKSTNDDFKVATGLYQRQNGTLQKIK